MSRLTDDSTYNIKMIITLSNQQYPNNKVMADLTAAQAILESGLSRNKPSKLAKDYCNLFGQKPGKLISKGTQGLIYMWTKEYLRGKEISVKAPFLFNHTIEDSLAQHKKLFEELPRYQHLSKCESFEHAAKAVQVAGYATDPNYSKELIRIYNQYIKEKQ